MDDGYRELENSIFLGHNVHTSQVSTVKAGKSESDGKPVQRESPGRSEFTSSGFGFIITDIQRGKISNESSWKEKTDAFYINLHWQKNGYFHHNIPIVNF